MALGFVADLQPLLWLDSVCLPDQDFHVPSPDRWTDPLTAGSTIPDEICLQNRKCASIEVSILVAINCELLVVYDECSHNSRHP